MQFTSPIFLWALSGLSIPIGIHLLSRKEGKVIRLGSLRHVHETSTQQFRGIRLNEILLLVLRCLLIVLFTLILSGLNWNTLGKTRWVLIEKGLESQPELITILDSLHEEGYEVRFLTEDFPLLEDGDSISSSKSYWRLIEELTSKNLSDVVVFASNRAINFKGLRSTLPANVRWISQPLPPIDFTLWAVQIKNDSVFVRESHTSSDATYFTTKRISRPMDIAEIESPDTISITLVSDEKYAYDRKIVKAALNTINKSFPIELKLTEIPSTNSIPNSDEVIWLSDNDIPEGAFKLVYIKPQPANHQELFFPIKSNHWIITERLNEEVALQENLTMKLASLLIPRKELEMKANSKDRRMISDSSAWGSTPAIDTRANSSVLSEFANPYLILLLLAVLLVERTIAYKRNQ